MVRSRSSVQIRSWAPREFDTMKITVKKIQEICNLYKTGYSMMLISEKMNISHNTVKYYLDKNGIPRRNLTEAGYLAHLHRFGRMSFRVKENLNSEEEKLKITGIMLYWAEGYKRNNDSSVAFSNSDPEMIKTFLRFLREICGIQEKRLRALLFLFKDQDEVYLKRRWSKILSLPIDQFNLSFIRKSRSDIGNYKRKSEFGTLLLRYNDKRLLNQILLWINEYISLNK